MESVLKELLEERKRELESLNHWAENEGCSNKHVMLCVAYRIAELEHEIGKLENSLRGGR